MKEDLDMLSKQLISFSEYKEKAYWMNEGVKRIFYGAKEIVSHLGIKKVGKQ